MNRGRIRVSCGRGQNDDVVRLLQDDVHIAGLHVGMPTAQRNGNCCVTFTCKRRGVTAAAELA